MVGMGKGDRLQLDLVSPERVLLTQAVEMVVVPGSEGDFAVMNGHVPVIAALRPGVITVYEKEQPTKRLFVAGGFVEVAYERCAVLAEAAEPVDGMDRAGVEQAIKNLSEDMADAKTDQERAAREADLAVAKAKLEAITGELVL